VYVLPEAEPTGAVNDKDAVVEVIELTEPNVGADNNICINIYIYIHKILNSKFLIQIVFTESKNHIICR
jgi:hypothetical protein